MDFSLSFETVWSFYFGAYQPVQKWLKARRERELSVEDVEHYQRMVVVALAEMGRVIGEIK